MLTYTLMSDKGDREQNEDFISLKVNGNQGFFALADGLGGHGKGEVASNLVVTEAIKIYEKEGCHTGFLEEIFEKSQNQLLEEQRRSHALNDMKTTMVLCSVTNDSICWGHIGDSRLYLFDKKKIKCRTIDHSVVQMLVYAGEIKEKNIRFHPDRNRLLKVMGTEWETPGYELSEIYDRKEGQAILICTDGFWEFIDEKNMEKTLKKSHSVEEWGERMREIVLHNGSNKNMDNYSAVCIWL